MGEIATSNRLVILYYNTDSVLAEKTLSYAKTDGLPILEVDILKTPFTGTQLEELADRLHMNIDGLTNKEHPDFKKKFGKLNFSDEYRIKILRKNPQLLKEPIAIKGDKTIFIKTPSDILKI